VYDMATGRLASWSGVRGSRAVAAGMVSYIGGWTGLGSGWCWLPCVRGGVAQCGLFTVALVGARLRDGCSFSNRDRSGGEML
jgi:hypothetical protein